MVWLTVFSSVKRFLGNLGQQLETLGDIEGLLLGPVGRSHLLKKPIGRFFGSFHELAQDEKSLFDSQHGILHGKVR